MIRLGAFEPAKPLLLWNDVGLMAVFFFLVGLKITCEVMEGYGILGLRESRRVTRHLGGHGAERP